MIDFTIKVENEQVKDAFINFLVNYKGNISDYMNQLIGNDGSPVDTDVDYTDGVLTVYHIAPDKGFVLGETGNEELPIQIQQYKDLAVDTRYILPNKDRLTLYYKQDEGQADITLGAFKTLADAIKGFNSEAVKTTLVNVETMKKAREKDLKRMKKLGKTPVKIEEAEVVPNTNE